MLAPHLRRRPGPGSPVLTTPHQGSSRGRHYTSGCVAPATAADCRARLPLARRAAEKPPSSHAMGVICMNVTPWLSPTTPNPRFLKNRIAAVLSVRVLIQIVPAPP